MSQHPKPPLLSDFRVQVITRVVLTTLLYYRIRAVPSLLYMIGKVSFAMVFHNCNRTNVFD
jgi:hypothetical protein